MDSQKARADDFAVAHTKLWSELIVEGTAVVSCLTKDTYGRQVKRRSDQVRDGAIR